jgi:large subunit ribosomal protein L4
MEEPKSKAIAGMIKAMGLEGKSTLIATAEHSPMVYKSARNVAQVDVMQASDLNALAILKPHRVLVEKATLEQFKEQAKEKKAEA